MPVAVLRDRMGPRLDSFFKKYTLTFRPKVGRPIHVKQYEAITLAGKACVCLPRTLIADMLQESIIERLIVCLPARVKYTHPWAVKIEMYSNQIAVVDHLMGTIFTEERMTAGTACAILNMGAGMGKTFVCASIAARLGLRTLFITLRKSLCDQAVADFRRCFCDEDTPHELSARIGKFERKNHREGAKNQDVTAIVINSALKQNKEFFAGYSFVVFDEVHTYCSDQRKEIFKKCSQWVCLGMSATTADRNDGFDAIAHDEIAFGGVIHADGLPGFDTGSIIFNMSAEVVNYKGPPEHTKTLYHDSTDKLFCPYMNAQFMADPYRNALVVAEIRKLVSWRGPAGEKHCVLVFCEECGPLNKMLERLIAAFGADAVECPEMGTFMGGISADKVTEMRNCADILLATYAYAGTGISIIRATAIVFLTSRRSGMKQILARIMRLGSDVNIPREVIDIVDARTPIKFQLGSRMQAYEHYGFAMSERTVHWEDVQLPLANSSDK